LGDFQQLFTDHLTWASSSIYIGS